MVGGFFAILDDIAMLMDDAAAVTKITVKNTVPLPKISVKPLASAMGI